MVGDNFCPYLFFCSGVTFWIMTGLNGFLRIHKRNNFMLSIDYLCNVALCFCLFFRHIDVSHISSVEMHFLSLVQVLPDAI